jgi:nickel transport protein
MRKTKDQTRNTKHHYDFQSVIQNPKSAIELLTPDTIKLKVVFMKLAWLRISIIVPICFGVLAMLVGSASAHGVNVFAWLDGDTIHVESKFSGGKKVKAGKIVVMDPQGVELLSGQTNDQGKFSFKVPKRTDLKIVLIAGQGHQGEWTLRADEMKKLPSETALEASVEKASPSEGKETVSKTGMDPDTAAPDTAIKPKEMEAIIETVLDKKLKPITRMLTDLRQEGPSVRDIIAGIGYIFGLVGIAAYVHSRKKKD